MILSASIIIFLGLCGVTEGLNAIADAIRAFPHISNNVRDRHERK